MHQLINRTLLIPSALALALLFTAPGLFAQNAANYSGKWEFDSTKSIRTKVETPYPWTLIRQITQNKVTFTYRDIYIQPGSTDWSTSNEVFKLDGKEEVKKDRDRTRRKSIKWSQDKKTLDLIYNETYLERGVSKELSMIESYRLSEDGKTLTIDTYSKNQVTGESRGKRVYHKK